MDSWLLMMLAFVAVLPPAIFQALSVSGRAEPALSVSGRAEPALSVSGRAAPALSVSGSAAPALSVSGRAAPALSVAGRSAPALSFSGRSAPALSGSGLSAPALSVSGRNRRLLMTDFSKPTHAPAPAPASSHNNAICINCCPQKTVSLFSVFNKVFGWGLAVYLSLGILYFLYCSCLSIQNLPNLPRVQLHLEEGDIVRLQNLVVSAGLDRPTEERLRATTRVRTKLDVHIDKHNTGDLVLLTGRDEKAVRNRFRAAYDYSTSWMIPIGKPFLVCYLALKFAWPVFETFGAPAWAGTWSI